MDKENNIVSPVEVGDHTRIHKKNYEPLNPLTPEPRNPWTPEPLKILTSEHLNPWTSEPLIPWIVEHLKYLQGDFFDWSSLNFGYVQIPL